MCHHWVQKLFCWLHCCNVDTILVVASKPMHMALGIGGKGGRWAFISRRSLLYTVCSGGKHFSIIWRGGKRENITNYPPLPTHTQRQRNLMKVTCSINSCCSQPALLIKTLSLWLLQWNATCLNQQASTQPTSSCLFPALPVHICLGVVPLSWENILYQNPVVYLERSLPIS